MGIFPEIRAQSDLSATAKTKSLYTYLKSISGQEMLFGQQYYSANGRTWDDPSAALDKSDSKTSVGSHPAILGLNYAHDNDFLIRHITEAYKNGGIITMHWTFYNIITGGNHADRSDTVVNRILPNGDKHSLFQQILDTLANFALTLKDDDGYYIPVIFRPFHENTGTQFWWSNGMCTPDEYKELYQFLVGYLRSKGVHHFLYAYSPGKPTEHGDYNTWYPGDDVVDIIAFDRYDPGHVNFPDRVVDDCRIVVEFAEQRGKVAAIAETGVKNGLANTQDNSWYINKFFQPVMMDSIARKVSYMLVWKNTSSEYWIPLPRDRHYEAFKIFYDDPYTTFLNDLPGNIYQWIPVSANETVPEKNKFYIYPQPASEFIGIRSIDRSGFTTIRIFTIHGQLLLESNPEENTSQIRLNISHLKAGTYLLTIKSTSNQVFSKLLTKQ